MMRKESEYAVQALATRLASELAGSIERLERVSACHDGVDEAVNDIACVISELSELLKGFDTELDTLYVKHVKYSDI